jgi:predicted restriction endonuclease
MLPSKKLVNKKHEKLRAGKCYFCDEDNYDLLELHRIIPGGNGKGGKYTEINTVTLCSNHHKLVEKGYIKINRKYLTSNGKWVLNYIDQLGIEHFD